MGVAPWLVVADLDMLKQILVKEFDSFADRPVSVLLASVPQFCTVLYCIQPLPDILRRKASSSRGLLQSRGAEWRMLRQTLSPSFSAAKMKMVCVSTSQCVCVCVTVIVCSRWCLSWRTVLRDCSGTSRTLHNQEQVETCLSKSHALIIIIMLYTTVLHKHTDCLVLSLWRLL